MSHDTTASQESETNSNPSEVSLSSSSPNPDFDPDFNPDFNPDSDPDLLESSSISKDTGYEEQEASQIIDISNLQLSSLQANQQVKVIYQGGELKAFEGEIVLILGSSGGGKSLLMNYLLNLCSLSTESLILEQHPNRLPKFNLYFDQECYEIFGSQYPQNLDHKIGVMFQQLGLIEDLTVEQNLSFANDHSQSPQIAEEWTRWKNENAKLLGLRDLLTEPLAKLSGGQRQRVALARMLASQPEIMIFDEPTSALDPLTSQNVVHLIQHVHQTNHSKLTLIITHDYEDFLPIADRVWFIGPDRFFHDHSPARSAHEYLSLLTQTQLPAVHEINEGKVIQHIAQCKDLTLKNTKSRLQIFLRRARHSIFSKGQNSSNKLIPLSRWFIFYLRYFFKQILLKGLPFHIIAGLSLGMIATYFSFNLELGSVEVAQLGQNSTQNVEISRFIIPTFFQEMLSGFGVVLYKALIPLFTCICIAARAGTAVTAYLANIRDPRNKQWEAMSNLGVEPYAFFSPQIIVTFCFSCVFISYLAFIFASLGCLLVSLATNPLCTWYTWSNTYLAGLKIHHIMWPNGTTFFILKTLLSGLWIALISIYYGSKIRKSTMESMQDLAQANVMSVLSVLLTFFILLLIE
jgi:ABC-type lipoprotein export system ATPase subunit/ABC-type transporter Mla maintaining outer membrane lipid asymmetry permease subunit MlaE